MAPPKVAVELKAGGGQNVVQCISYVAGKDWVLCGGWDGIVLVFEVKTKKVLYDNKNKDSGKFDGTVNAVAYNDEASGGDGLVYAASDDRIVRSFSLTDANKTSMKVVMNFQGHTREVRSMVLDPDQHKRKNMYTGAWDNYIKVWDLTNGECKNTFKDHRCPVDCLVIGGGYLFSGSWDRTIKSFLLDGIDDAKECAGNAEGKDALSTSEVDGHSDAVLSLAYCHKSKTLFSGGRDFDVLIWQEPGAKFPTPKRYSKFKSEPCAMSANPSSNEVVVASFGDQPEVVIFNTGDMDKILETKSVFGKLKEEVFSCAAAEDLYWLGMENCKIQAYKFSESGK